MSDKIEKYCPKCEREIIGMPHHFTAKYCFFCGGKLVPYVEKTEPEEPWTSMVTKSILKAIDDLRKYSNEEAEEREKKKKSIFKKTHNYYKNVIYTDGIKLTREEEYGYTIITVIKEDLDQTTSGDIIAQYATENFTGAKALWDDLNAILLIPAHPDNKERRFMEFKIENKPYGGYINDVIYEEGEPYAK